MLSVVIYFLFKINRISNKRVYNKFKSDERFLKLRENVINYKRESDEKMRVQQKYQENREKSAKI